MGIDTTRVDAPSVRRERGLPSMEHKTKSAASEGKRSEPKTLRKFLSGWTLG